MLKPVLTALCLTPLLAACTTTPPSEPLGPSEAPPSAEADLEPIYAIRLGRDGATVRVNSNGCTKKADFQIQLLDGWPASTLILRRTRPDMCRAFVAGGTELTFSHADMGLKTDGKIVLANPLAPDPTPGR